MVTKSVKAGQYEEDKFLAAQASEDYVKKVCSFSATPCLCLAPSNDSGTKTLSLTSHLTPWRLTTYIRRDAVLSLNPSGTASLLMYQLHPRPFSFLHTFWHYFLPTTIGLLLTPTLWIFNFHPQTGIPILVTVEIDGQCPAILKILPAFNSIISHLWWVPVVFISIIRWLSKRNCLKLISHQIP